MKVIKSIAVTALAIIGVLLIPSAVSAQHKHGTIQPKPTKASGMKAEMARMMKTPHHKLMMTYAKNMSAFAKLLRDQAASTEPLDASLARTTVSEIRHDLNAGETLKQKHMSEMSSEMKAKMMTMMEKMEKEQDAIKDLVGQLESDVQADSPDAALIRTHANALVKKLDMMPKKSGRSRPVKKMTM